MIRKIAAVTSSRADYSHLYWVLKELSRRPEVKLSIISIGAHLSVDFGNTWKNLDSDGFAMEKIECLLSSDTDVGMAKTIGVATLGLADCLGKMRPDLLLLIADRYEMLASASVALALRIPVVHIEGGDVSLGAIDEAVRNALTKLSHIHLTATERSRRRVIAMGEEPWRVHRVGSPSLDHLAKQALLTRPQLEQHLQIMLAENTVGVIYHPVTLLRDTLLEVDELLAALERVSQPLLLIGPNPDAGSRELLARLGRFVATRNNASLITTIDHLAYLSLLQYLSALVGNSSSGVMEAASFRLPVVNVGLRQKGREAAANVLHCRADRTEIESAIGVALAPAFRESLADLVNPYGDGHSAEKIAHVLTTVPLSESLLAKEPVPLPSVEEYEHSSG
jgi:UDP-hydrolysing UDP-N-acetyl-D-glucosamine 2-epimerase